MNIFLRKHTVPAEAVAIWFLLFVGGLFLTVTRGWSRPVGMTLSVISYAADVVFFGTCAAFLIWLAWPRGNPRDWWAVMMVGIIFGMIVLSFTVM